jgi:hypothetical protein
MRLDDCTSAPTLTLLEVLMLRPVMASVLASALALACGEQPSPTAPADFFLPSLRGSTERFTVPLGFQFGNDQLTVGVGGTAEQWAAVCATGEPQDFDPWTLLFVTRPDGSQKTTFKGQNLHILIWDIPGFTPFPGDICGEDPVYTGIGHIITTDSDVDLSHVGADASGVSLIGSVSDASGQRYHLVAAVRLTVKENTLDNFVIDVHAAKIQLTPIGH